MHPSLLGSNNKLSISIPIVVSLKTWIFTNHAFEHLCTVLASSDINLSITATNDEQVPEILNALLMSSRSTTTSPISNLLPNIMKIKILLHFGQILNLTIHLNSVSDTLSPSSIILGTHLDINMLALFARFMMSPLYLTVFILLHHCQQIDSLHQYHLHYYWHLYHPLHHH